jgi:hypothetical protein
MTTNRQDQTSTVVDGACRPGRSVSPGSVRSVTVVVVHEDGENGFEIRLIEDQQPVETLCANGAYKPFGHAVHLRCANVNSRVSPY